MTVALRTWVLCILQVVDMMQMRVVMMVMEDAFQIGTIQHCHGAPAAPAADSSEHSRSLHTFTKLFHWHQTRIVVTSRYLLGHGKSAVGTHGGGSRVGAARSATDGAR